MKIRTYAIAALLAALCTAPASAHVITASGFPTFALSPSADTLTLDGSSQTGIFGAFNLQNGTYFVGDSGNLMESEFFTIPQTITIDGVTQTVSLNVENDVFNPSSRNTDNLIISGTSIFFGGAANTLLTIDGFNSDDFGVGGSQDFTLTASLTDRSPVPEPVTLSLFGAGLAGAAALRRRKKAKV
jgi:hypothetical protein